MPFCQNCHAENVHGAQHCTSCGLPLEQFEAQQPQYQPQTYEQPVSQYGGQYQAPRPGPIGEKGFFASLFDFSFRSYIYVRVLGIVWGIIVVVITLEVIAGIIFAFDKAPTFGIIALILSPFVWLILLIINRMGLELSAVLFLALEKISRKY